MKTRAMFAKPLDDKAVRCLLCAHHCKIAPGEAGFCRVRVNEDGTLYTLAYGETVARNVDPIEKKPLYHFLPGSLAYSVATAGCNFHCGFCQNWQISRAAVDRGVIGDGRPFAPEAVVQAALANACASIAYTYTEPTIYFEYGRAIALAAKAQGIKNVFVTNGYMTRQALEEAAGWLDAANVDLKFWNERAYREACRGRLKPVLETIRRMKELGIWLEVTTLIIPGHNDGDEDLEGMAAFLAGVGTDIPWHISRFHPDYQFDRTPPTPLETLEKAERIGRSAGLKYIYPGNVADVRDTVCPACGAAAVLRFRGGVRQVRLKDGRCPDCGAALEGRWR
jgi:pyruvate formate lyase activating enzyme